MKHFDWLLTYVWEVWLDEKILKQIFTNINIQVTRRAR